MLLSQDNLIVFLLMTFGSGNDLSNGSHLDTRSSLLTPITASPSPQRPSCDAKSTKVTIASSSSK